MLYHHDMGLGSCFKIYRIYAEFPVGWAEFPVGWAELPVGYQISRANVTPSCQSHCRSDQSGGGNNDGSREDEGYVDCVSDAFDSPQLTFMPSGASPTCCNLVDGLVYYGISLDPVVLNSYAVSLTMPKASDSDSKRVTISCTHFFDQPRAPIQSGDLASQVTPSSRRNQTGVCEG
jgi:hypothetical protein